MNGRFLLILLILIIWFILGWFFFNKYICGFSAATAAAVPAAVPVEKCNTEWIVKDGNKFNSKSQNHYQFQRSKFTPIVNGINKLVSETSNYLKANPNRGMTITGLYDTAEKNNSILGDLGLARANSIKRILMDKGVAGGQLNISSRVSDADCYERDTLRRGATFAFNDLNVGKDRLDAIKARLLGKPITVYFATNQDNLTLSAQQRTDFTDLIYYLDNVNTANLNVEGHTDNVGNRASNINLSKSRAEFARDYLKRNGGIPDARMNVNGFGPDKPVQTNNTAEGRSKNRRVEVTLIN